MKLLTERYPRIIEQKSDTEWTGFICACYNNNVEIIKILTDKYPFIIDQKENKHGWTGFTYACRYDRIEVLKLLLDKSPSAIEQKDNYGYVNYQRLS